MSSFTFTNVSPERPFSPSKQQDTKTIDPIRYGSGTYHILRLCADDPENDTTAKEIIARTRRHLRGTDSPLSSSESLVAEYHIERTSQRICNVLRRLELSDTESLSSLESEDIFTKSPRGRGTSCKKRKRQPDLPFRAFNDQVR